MSMPRRPRWETVLRLLRYLKGSLHKGLYSLVSTDLSLHTYCDSDWVACTYSRKSLWVLHLLGPLPHILKNEKNKPLFLSSQLRLSIVQWPTLWVSFSGLVIFSKTCRFQLNCLYHYTVIVKQPCTILLT